MVWTVLRVMAALTVTAIAAGTVTITGYLGRLHTGIKENVAVATLEVEAMENIRRQNQQLDELAALTRSINGRMGLLVATTDTIVVQVDAMGASTRQTLNVNQILIANNEASSGALLRVVASLQQMRESAGGTADHLSDIGLTIAGDVELLDTLAVNTARMNTRTPGGL